MGLYIAFEGIDGSGKSKQLELLNDSLNQQDFSTLTTSELGSPHDNFCFKIRELILSDKFEADELVYQTLLAASSFQHSEKVLKPSIDKFDFILSDRSIISNLVYGVCSQIEESTISNLFLLDKRRIFPDLTLFLDIDPQVAFSRRKKREPENFTNNGRDRIESKSIEFQHSLREQYLNQLDKSNRNYLVIDASLSITQTHNLILDNLTNFLSNKDSNGLLTSYCNDMELSQRINKWLKQKTPKNTFA